MKRFDSGEALAMEFGVAPEVLRKTFDDYNMSVRTQKDPFGKKVCSSIFDIPFRSNGSPSSSKANGSSMTSSMWPS
jgi:hypothetical protein